MDLFYRLNVVCITLPPLRTGPRIYRSLYAIFCASKASRWGSTNRQSRMKRCSFSNSTIARQRARTPKSTLSHAESFLIDTEIGEAANWRVAERSSTEGMIRWPPAIGKTRTEPGRRGSGVDMCAKERRVNMGSPTWREASHIRFDERDLETEQLSLQPRQISFSVNGTFEGVVR
jgi:hypothetical protein